MSTVTAPETPASSASPRYWNVICGRGTGSRGGGATSSWWACGTRKNSRRSGYWSASPRTYARIPWCCPTTKRRASPSAGGRASRRRGTMSVAWTRGRTKPSTGPRPRVGIPSYTSTRAICKEVITSLQACQRGLRKDRPFRSPLSVPATEDVGGFGAVVHPKQLVGGAQVLFYGGLREVKVPAYLGVGESFDHVTQDLPLAGREGGEVAGVILGQHVPKQLPRRDEIPLGGHLHGAYELVGRHLGVDETRGSRLQGVAG